MTSEEDKATSYSSRATRDWTQGNITRNLFALSWPMILSSSFNLLGPTVDMIWVGKLGSDAIGGVGGAGIVVMLSISLIMGLFVGLRALVSRNIGARNPDGARHAAQQSMVIAAITSLIMAIIGIFLAEPILKLTGSPPEIIVQGIPYLRVNLIGMVALSFRMMTDNTMQASGDSMNPLKISIIFRLFHVALCPFLVFGLWIFPHMGVTGAALTNVLSQSLGTIIGIWILVSGRTRLKLSFKNFHFDPKIIWSIVKIGIPGSVMGMQMNLSQFVLMRFIAPFGAIAIAAHSLNQRIEMFLFMPTMGLGLAAGVLAGQNLGAEQPGQAEKAGWIAGFLGQAFTITCAVAVLLWAEKIVPVFNSEPALVEMASTFLRIAAAGYLVLGISSVLQQCISGAGDTLLPMIVSIVATWLIQLPLAFLLPQHTNLGVNGVRWAMATSIVITAMIYVIYFRIGKWKRKVL